MAEVIVEIEKASPVEMRQMLEAVEGFKKGMLRFVPMPVLNSEDNKKLLGLMASRLQILEKATERYRHD